MALKLSTGLRDYLLDMGSMRKAFENAVIKIYTGVAPSTADLVPTGTLLCTVTKASGTVSADETNEGKITVVTITAANLLTTATLAGVAYTVNSAGATITAINLAIMLAQLINRTSPDCIAVATGDAGTLNVMSRIEGQTFTSAGTANCSVSDKVAVTREDTLQFAAASSGVIAKNGDVWSGANVATGVAGYFRLITSGDLGTENTTDIRLQGSCNTSGADLNMSNVSLTSGATTTIDTFSITLPAS
jgi:hypothetical protein